MLTDRRRLIVLGVLAVALVVLVYRAWQPTAGRASGTAGAGAGRQTAPGTARDVALDVRLEMLDAARVQPEGAHRNPFRFQARAAPAPTASPTAAPSPAPSAGPSALPAGPTVAPIGLKFIGLVEQDGSGPRIAVLSDARGVVHGREGEVILGQYRILRIGADSIDLAHVDGRGRQTLRLNGS